MLVLFLKALQYSFLFSCSRAHAQNGCSHARTIGVFQIGGSVIELMIVETKVMKLDVAMKTLMKLTIQLS